MRKEGAEKGREKSRQAASYGLLIALAMAFGYIESLWKGAFYLVELAVERYAYGLECARGRVSLFVRRSGLGYGRG